MGAERSIGAERSVGTGLSMTCEGSTTRRLRSRGRTSVLLLLVALVTFTGCREDIILPARTDHPFTLYGILNPRADRQAIVVFPMKDRLRPIDPEPIDAVLTSTDLETGEVRVWSDSLVFDEDGGFSHVFWSNFRPVYGRSYRIEAVQSAGEPSTVVVNVPPEVSAEVEELGSVLVRVRFPGSGLRVINAIVHYTVGADPFVYTFPIDYTTRARKDEGTWTLSIRLDQYSEWLYSWHYHNMVEELLASGHSAAAKNASRLADPQDHVRVPLLRLRVNVTIAEDAWRPPRELLHDPFETPSFIEDMSRYVNPLFDADVVNHPDILTNVENGFGFVGGGYRQLIDLCPPDEMLDASGFIVPVPRPCQPMRERFDSNLSGLER